MIIKFVYRFDFTPTEEEKTAVLKMFSNDLIIPKNFVSLENYKTKTNPQTTKFCNQLCVDDPLALVLGQWPGTGTTLFQSDSEIDSTFSSFVNSTVCSNNEDESLDKTSEKLNMSLLMLPEPKNDTFQADSDENSYLNNISNVKEISTEESKSKEFSETHNLLQGKYYYLFTYKIYKVFYYNLPNFFF